MLRTSHSFRIYHPNIIGWGVQYRSVSSSLCSFLHSITSIFRALICIMCIQNQQNALNSTDVFLLWYFHLHVPQCILVTELSPWRWSDYRPKHVDEALTIKYISGIKRFFFGPWYTLFFLQYFTWSFSCKLQCVHSLTFQSPVLPYSYRQA
jgi:hypothetical protein